MSHRIRVSSFALVLGVALLACTAVPQMRASEFDKKTIVTFSGPVELSGQVLSAGTYVFKTLGENREVVMVTNQDENHVFATLITVPVEASTIPDKPQVELSERAANAPEAIHAWFYPGDNVGWEFPDHQVKQR